MLYEVPMHIFLPMTQAFDKKNMYVLQEYMATFVNDVLNARF